MAESAAYGEQKEHEEYEVRPWSYLRERWVDDIILADSQTDEAWQENPEPWAATASGDVYGA